MSGFVEKQRKQRVHRMIASLVLWVAGFFIVSLSTSVWVGFGVFLMFWGHNLEPVPNNPKTGHVRDCACVQCLIPELTDDLFKRMSTDE